MGLALIASGGVFADRIVMSRRASLDFPPKEAEHQDIMGRTPAYHFASPMSITMPMDPLLNLLVRLLHQYEAISRPFVKQCLRLL
jgi:hypothetical protein